MTESVADEGLVAVRSEPDAVAAGPSQPMARIHRIGPAVSSTRRSKVRSQPGVTDGAIARWDDLFSRVERVLRLTLGEHTTAQSEAMTQRKVGQVPSTLTDAVAVLSELHTSLVQELAQRRQLESELEATRVALVREHGQLMAAQAVEKQARHLALHDSLTSLPNRSYLHAQLQRGLAPAPAQSEPRVLALLYLDLDGFKQINDTHGHAVGDDLLRIVAVRLQRAVRVGDMVSRVGGDEFACLPADPLDRHQLTELAFKLFNTVSAPLKLDSREFTVRPSIGIAVFPADGQSVETLIRSADAAMYRAKRLQTRVEFFGRHAGV